MVNDRIDKPVFPIMPMRLRCVFALLLLLASTPLHAIGTYQAPEDFIRQVFAGKPPDPKLLWLTPAIQTEVVRILGHEYAQRRVRYWRQNARSAWILEEIGKEEPITTGFIIEGGRIEQIKVLIYRESRGDEVRYPRFTRQFKDARLTADKGLDRTIDVISGATMSVSALTRLARLALYLHSQTEP